MITINKNLLALLPIALACDCASYSPEKAQLADTSVTAAIISAGGSELNPLFTPLVGSPGGLIAMATIKVGAVQAAKTMEDKSECTDLVAALEAGGWTGGALGAVSIVLGPGSLVVAPIVYTYSRQNAYWSSAFQSCYHAEGVHVFAISNQEKQSYCSKWYKVPGTHKVNKNGIDYELYQGFCDLGNLDAQVIAAQTHEGVEVIPLNKDKLKLFLSEKDRQSVDDGTAYLVRTDGARWDELLPL